VIRHPLLRAAQAAAASAALALVVARATASPGAVSFSLAAVGERERSDGAWDGVDLLHAPKSMVDRFQLNLTPETDARALLEAQAPDGSWDRLYQGTLKGRRNYALPAPHSFFAVQGTARVRLTISRMSGPPLEPSPATALAIEDGPPLPLSDGAPFRVTRTRFTSARAAQLELRLHGW
jgi:hypothetical protein